MVRASPMPADERRAALIAATEPLLDRFGRDVSTRRIAEAAGVAEGTIFRVFPTKDALIDAVCERVFDLDQALAELRQVEPATDLEDRLAQVVIIMQRRLRRIFALFHALGLDRRPHDVEVHRARQRADNDRLNKVIAELIEPDADRLRMPTVEAANVLRMLTLAMTHPLLSDPKPSEPHEIVELVLHGISTKSHHIAEPTGRPC